jgi:acetyltransferase-like isoleucine patch superfamily enzyme
MMTWPVYWQTFLGRLRAGIWRCRGAKLGRKVSVGPGCRIWLAAGIELGERVTLEGEVWFKLVSPEARLVAGARTFFGRGCHVNVLDRVEIGARCLFGPGCVIVDHNHGMDPGRWMDEQPCTARPVRIGDGVWCGARAVILPGVSIGDGAVIGAQSVVTRDVPPMMVAAGVPARILHRRGEPGPGVRRDPGIDWPRPEPI